MSLMHLAVVAAVLIAAGVVAVCAAHIPVLRVVVGAEPIGPVPEPEPGPDPWAEHDAAAEAEMRAMFHGLADAVLRQHHVTDGPPGFTDADRARLDWAWERGEQLEYLTHRAAMRMIRRAEPEERGADW